MTQQTVSQKPKTKKNIDSRHWRLEPQEQEGDYYFSGTFYVTSGVNSLLSPLEIIAIKAWVAEEVEKRAGLDYLQVFVRENDNQKLFMIDQLSRSQLESREFSQEDNYSTLMLASEY